MEVGAYMADVDAELRRRPPASAWMSSGRGKHYRPGPAYSPDAGSAAVSNDGRDPRDRANREPARTFVDVLATPTLRVHRRPTGLSDKRASAVAIYLAAHGVTKARIASRGLGESAPLYSPEMSETEKAANRRIEIRLVPYRG
jgi:hypothetical protein